MKKKKILISGAAGFIGSHLCESFLKDNFIVYGIDNLCTGSILNISHLNENKDFHFIEKDITKQFKFDKKVDFIMHFASPASPIDYLKMPIETLRVGSTGTENMLELAKKYNSTFLVASTSEVYGDPLEHPQSESYNGNVSSIGPRGVYDEAKRYLEALTIAYHRTYNLNVRIARIFNTYGPKMRKDDGRAIPTFINQALNNNNITIFGDGNQTRSFCYIEDTVNALKKLLFSNYPFPVNIGNPKEISLISLVRQILDLTKSVSELEFKKLPQDDPKRRNPNIDLAKSLLEWTPKISLENGLKKTINFFK
tara:strand:- start:2485 stop:3414 length:930 start_codon:yes stop_codon:yes gene_type:complete